MRWWWCSTLALAAVASCVRSSQRFFVPTEGQPRISTDALRQRSDALLRVECPRLLAGRESATGVASIRVDVRSGGEVVRAQIGRSSGDARMDEIFGGLAAQLQLSPPERATGDVTTGTVEIGFSCSPSSAVTTVAVK